MRNSEHDQAARKAHVDALREQAGLGPDFRKLNTGNPEPIIDRPIIREPISGPVDMDPLIGSTVLRPRKNRPPAKKRINSQIRFNERGEMVRRVPQVANSRGKLKQITPIETETNIKKEDQIDPDENALKARQQRHIIQDYYAKQPK